MFLDGDDFISKDLLEKASLEMNYCECDIFSFGFNIVDERNSILSKYSYNKFNNRLFTNKEFLNLYLTKQLRQCMCSFIVKKDLILSNNIYFDENTKFGEDQEFQLKLIAKSKMVKYNSIPFFSYVKHNNSAINSNITHRRLDTLKAMQRVKEFLENENIDTRIDNYMSYMYVYLYKQCKINNANKLIIDELISKDYLLKKFKISTNKYDLLTFIFIVAYITIIRPIEKIKKGRT